MPRKGRGKGGEEDRDSDGKTALREIWKDWEENGEQQQGYELESIGRERSERKVRRGKKTKRR